MLFLLDQPSHEKGTRHRKIRVSARTSPQRIDLEFLCGTSGVNLENAARHIDWDAPPSAEDTGLRILRGLAERVRHEQFHGTDVLMVSVESRAL